MQACFPDEDMPSQLYTKKAFTLEYSIQSSEIWGNLEGGPPLLLPVSRVSYPLEEHHCKTNHFQMTIIYRYILLE